jgi:hypothetical protein
MPRSRQPRPPNLHPKLLPNLHPRAGADRGRGRAGAEPPFVEFVHLWNSTTYENDHSLSWTIFTALGYLVALRLSTYDTVQKISIFLVMLLMGLIEVSGQTISVHCLAIIFGGALSLIALKCADNQ